MVRIGIELGCGADDFLEKRVYEWWGISLGVEFTL